METALSKHFSYHHTNDHPVSIVSAMSTAPTSSKKSPNRSIKSNDRQRPSKAEIAILWFMRSNGTIACEGVNEIEFEVILKAQPVELILAQVSPLVISTQSHLCSHIYVVISTQSHLHARYSCDITAHCHVCRSILSRCVLRMRNFVCSNIAFNRPQTIVKSLMNPIN